LAGGTDADISVSTLSNSHTSEDIRKLL